MLARPVFLDACAPGPGRSLPESGGILDGPGSADDFGSGSRKPFLSHGGVLSERESWDAIEDEHEELPCESGVRLRQLDFTGGMDTGDGVHWPGSYMLNIFSNFGPDPERSFPVSGGIMKFPEVSDTMDTGNVSPEAGVESIWPEFGDMAPRNMAGLCSRPRQRGMCPFRTTPGCAVFTHLLLDPFSISDDTAKAHLFIPNDMISCIMRLPGMCACLPGDSDSGLRETSQT